MSTPPTKGTTLRNGQKRTIDKPAYASAGTPATNNARSGPLMKVTSSRPPLTVVDLLSRIYAVEGTTKQTKHTKTQAESDVRRMSIATPKDDRTKPSPLLWPARSLPRFSFRVLRVFRGSTELLRLSDGGRGRRKVMAEVGRGRTAGGWWCR